MPRPGGRPLAWRRRDRMGRGTLRLAAVPRAAWRVTPPGDRHLAGPAALPGRRVSGVSYWQRGEPAGRRVRPASRAAWRQRLRQGRPPNRLAARAAGVEKPVGWTGARRAAPVPHQPAEVRPPAVVRAAAAGVAEKGEWPPDSQVLEVGPAPAARIPASRAPVFGMLPAAVAGRFRHGSEAAGQCRRRPAEGRRGAGRATAVAASPVRNTAAAALRAGLALPAGARRPGLDRAVAAAGAGVDRPAAFGLGTAAAAAAGPGRDRSTGTVPRLVSRIADSGTAVWAAEPPVRNVYSGSCSFCQIRLSA